ncbi:MAG: hypothetical protein ACRDN9_07770 [Streptosporangiaceae bacterium]
MNHSADDSSRTGAPLVSDRMRELLTRVAQDQADEQRSQAAALTDIRARLEGVEWVLQGVRDRELGDVLRRLESLEAGLQDTLDGAPEQPVPEWSEHLAERMDHVREQVEPIADLPALWADIGVVAESVDETLGGIQSIAETARDNARRFDDLSKRLDGLQGTLEAAAARFGRLEEALSSLAERAELLRGALDQLGERVDTALEGVGSRVEGVSGRVVGVDGRLDGIQGRLDGLDDRVGGLHERVEQIPDALRVSEVHRRLTELSNRPFIDYSERIDALDERIKQAELRVAEAVSDVGRDLRTRPDRAEVETAVGSVVGRILENANVQTRDRLAAVEDSVLALAEALLRRAHGESRTADEPEGAEPGDGTSGP